MKRISQTLPVFLAAALQVMPMLRSFFANPALAPNFAFILRWGIGTTAFLGTVDAVSGATSTFTTPNTFSGSVGNTFSNNVSISIGGGNQADSSDYFIVTAGSTSSPTLGNNQTTTVGMPPGLTFKSSWVNNASTIGAVIFGTPGTSGAYPFTVTCVSPGNAQLSQAVTITISGSTGPMAPAITTPPSPTTVVAGNNATFTVTASGTAPLGYYWLKNGMSLTNGGDISGANTNTLGVSATTTNDAANYSVIVSNSVGSITSSVAALTVVIPPAITLEPAPQTVTNGNNALFTVSAAGSAPLNYRWLKNGANIANGAKYTGVTTSALAVTAAASADAGNYSVAVTNLGGSITSSVAALTVLLPPAIVTPPASQSGTAGSAINLPVTASGTAPLSYQWFDSNGPLTDGASFTGSTSNELTITSLSTNETGGYYVVVSNSVGVVTSAVANVSINVSPGIVTQPASQTIARSNTVSFTVHATGSDPLVYQWLCDGINLTGSANISGPATPTLTITSAGTNNSGNYSVVVTNGYGSATSSIAVLSVLIPPAITQSPTNRVARSGTNVTFTVAASGSGPLTYQWYKDGQPLGDGGNISGSASSALAVSAISAGDAGTYSVAVSNAIGGAVSSGATLAILSTPVIVTPLANQNVIISNSASFSVTVTGTSPLHYQWFKGTTAIKAATNSVYTLASALVANDGAYSVTITNSAGKAVSASAALTVFVPPAFTLQASNRAVKLGTNTLFHAAASGTAPLSFQWYKDGVPLTDGGDFSGAVSNVLKAALSTTNDAGAYSLSVSNFAGTLRSSNAVLGVLLPPVIVTEPRSETVTVSNNAVFQVTALGGNLRYQWRKGLKAIRGATNNLLQIAKATAKDATNYSVIVANIAGTVASSNAALIVVSPPVASTLQEPNAMPIAPLVIAAHPFVFTQIMRNNDSSFTLNAQGIAGSNYVLQASADLLHWSALQTNTAGADGSLQFSDPAAAQLPARFYRLTRP